MRRVGYGRPAGGTGMSWDRIRKDPRWYRGLKVLLRRVGCTCGESRGAGERGAGEGNFY